MKNLIINSGFETGTLAPFTGLNVLIQSNNSHSGKYSAIFPGGLRESKLMQSVPIVPGSRLQFIVSLSKGDEKPGPPITLGIAYQTSSFVFIEYGLKMEIQYNQWSDVLEKNRFEFIQYPTPPPPNATYAQVFIMKSPAKGTADVLIDTIQLLELNHGNVGDSLYTPTFSEQQLQTMQLSGLEFLDLNIIGSTGEIGVTGPLGATGATGFTGPTGETGPQISSVYGQIYNTSGQTVTSGSSVTFNNNASLSGISHSASSANIVVNTSGTYFFMFRITVQSVVLVSKDHSFAIYNNGTIVANTNFGISTPAVSLTNTGDYELSGSGIITVSAGNTLTLRNTTGASITLPTGIGTQTVANASVLLFLIS